MYNKVSALGTVSECDSVITVAQQRKNTLVGRKTILEIRINNSETSIASHDAEYNSVIADMNLLAEQIPLLPDGPDKNEKIIEVARLNYRKLVLENSRITRGPADVVDREYDLKVLEAEIALTEELIASVETHKITLPV